MGIGKETGDSLFFKFSLILFDFYCIYYFNNFFEKQMQKEK